MFWLIFCMDKDWKVPKIRNEKDMWLLTARISVKNSHLLGWFLSVVVNAFFGFITSAWNQGQRSEFLVVKNCEKFWCFGQSMTIDLNSTWRWEKVGAEDREANRNSLLLLFDHLRIHISWGLFDQLWWFEKVSSYILAKKWRHGVKPRRKKPPTEPLS